MTQKVLKAGKIPSDWVSPMLHSSYGSRDYCVQYQESDLDFVQRLWEEEGIFYFFEHEKDRDKLVLGDGSHAFATLASYAEARLRDSPHLHEEGLFEFRAESALRPGATVLRDVKFKQPGIDLEAAAQSDKFADYKMYYFPGEYVDASMGQQLAKLRLEELQCQKYLFVGSGNVRAMAPGHKFTLVGHRRNDCNQEYLIISVTHSGTQPQALAEEVGEHSKPTYENRVECIPAKVAYRPPRQTPAPSISGVQTAVVVGPPGEEIHCDEHGRVKVQFHWDRQGKKDDNSSCWVRVSQPWGGTGQGGMFIPRVGQEVVVQFLEGDPDRPLIVGRVYNGENPVPHGLPAAKNISTIRSSSTPGGGGFNELKFDDSAGSEEVFFHAQKDHNEIVGHDHEALVKNDQRETVQMNRKAAVGINENLKVGSNQDLIVGANRTTAIGANKTTSVGGSHTETVSGNMTISVVKNLTETVAINYAETVGVAMELTIGASFVQSVGGMKQVSIGGLLNETIGISQTTEVGTVVSLSAGEAISHNAGQAISLEAGQTIGLAAGKEIGLKAGTSASVQAGEQIVLSAGKKVSIVAEQEISVKTGSAELILKSSGEIVVKGSSITVKASGDVVVKGSKISLN